MRVAIYARESLDDSEKAPPIENQIEIGKNWIDENHHELTEIFADDGWSGGNWKRPRWNEIVSQARARQFSIIWVWSRARIARDVEQFAWFYRQVKERGCKVYVEETHDFIDMETLGGYAKEISLAHAMALMRIQTGQAVKNTYVYKKKEANRRGEKVGWGRKPIPEEIKVECIRLAKEQPDLSIRQLALRLPSYKNMKGTDKQVSYGWVAKILKEAGFAKRVRVNENVKEYPTNQHAVESQEKDTSTNGTIPEQEKKEEPVKETKEGDVNEGKDAGN